VRWLNHGCHRHLTLRRLRMSLALISAVSTVAGVDSKPDKRLVNKPTLFANTAAGFQLLQDKLAGLGVPTEQILIGMEATSRYGDALFHFLQRQGYQLGLLHPAQTHQFTQRRGLRAKTDKLDAITIGHVLRSRRSARWLRPG
jgi:transposase